jgi:methionine synthase I (cobalamin-dependent)
MATTAVILLDGGMGHELKVRAGCVNDGFMRSAVLNEEEPAAVEGVHSDFIAVGCNAITTNNFVVTRAALSRAGMHSSRVAPLTQAAVARARAAAGATKVAGRITPPLVVGALPPLGATCYDASLVPVSVEQLEEEYREIVTDGLLDTKGECGKCVNVQRRVGGPEQATAGC